MQIIAVLPLDKVYGLPAFSFLYSDFPFKVGTKFADMAVLVAAHRGEILKSPLDPPADPLNEFNKVLSEAREIRERVTQGLQASLVEPKFSESMLPTAAAPGPTAGPSPDISMQESRDEPSLADLTPSQ